jgi:hypothetical protein
LVYIKPSKKIARKILIKPLKLMGINRSSISEKKHLNSRRSTSLLLSETPLEILSRIPQAQLSTFLLSFLPSPLLFSVHTSRTTTSSATKKLLLPNESNIDITNVDKSFRKMSFQLN